MALRKVYAQLAVGRGVRLNPSFDFQKIYTHLLTVHFKCPPFESGPLVLITTVQMSLVAATRVCSWRPAWNAHISCLCRCDESTRVNTCVNKLLVQALESCPSSDVTQLQFCQPLVPSLVEIGSQLA